MTNHAKSLRKGKDNEILRIVEAVFKFIEEKNLLVDDVNIEESFWFDFCPCPCPVRYKFHVCIYLANGEHISTNSSVNTTEGVMAELEESYKSLTDEKNRQGLSAKDL